MPSPQLTLDGQSLAIGDVVRVAREPGLRIGLDPSARDALVRSRGLVEQAIASGQTIYGINTGFGKLANVRIAPDRLEQLCAELGPNAARAYARIAPAAACTPYAVSYFCTTWPLG